MDCSAELIDVVAGSPAVAAHLHVPLQHASDRILAAMHRPYDLQSYARTVDRIRERLPDAAIGTDVMVGFPGEEERDVDFLCTYLDRSPLTSLHVFPYSERPLTDATTYSGKVHGRLVRDRSLRVRETGATLHERFVRAQVGRQYRSLTLEDGTLALTGNYCKVRIPPGYRRNAWVTVRIDGVAPTMTGEVVA
jgi:threonylcarbamoyladenosine tRNA methylthiotransferase MtaB